MEHKVYDIILSGLGGQGILFLSKILAEAAMREGYLVRGAETHGMAQRGGSVIGHLRIGDVSSSLIRQNCADCLLSLDEIEAYRNINYLKPEGVLCVNTPKEDFPIRQVKEFLEKKKIRAYGFDCLSLAIKEGMAQSTNIGLIGFSLGLGFLPIPYNQVVSVIQDLSKGPSKEKNLKILEEAYREGKRIQGDSN